MTAKSLLSSSLIWLAGVKVTGAWCQANHMGVSISPLFIYDLNRFVNEIMFTHEMIDTLNDFMLIEEYKIMLVINRINEKNRRMFFDNIIYVSFTDVILIFVTRFKKQDFV
jgi:hypothetical protein